CPGPGKINLGPIGLAGHFLCPDGHGPDHWFLVLEQAAGDLEARTQDSLQWEELYQGGQGILQTQGYRGIYLEFRSFEWGLPGLSEFCPAYICGPVWLGGELPLHFRGTGLFHWSFHLFERNPGHEVRNATALPDR